MALLEAMVLTLRQRLQEEEQRSAALEQELGGSRQEVAELAAARQELLEDVALLRGRLGDTEARLQQAVARNEGLELQVGRLARALCRVQCLQLPQHSLC